MYKVIIVEDDPMVASINSQYLRSFPQLKIVGRFSNGAEALEYIKNKRVDLALVDYYMPVCDGADFVHQCRSLHISIDIIMITAANGSGQIHDLMQMGVIDYLIKPFTRDRFSKSINMFLDRHKALVDNKEFSQQEIDLLLSSSGKQQEAKHDEKAYEELEKGIQRETLIKIKNFLNQHPDSFYSSIEIANEVALSRITVRRYMNYLLDSNYIISQVDYTTGGRPSIKYRVSTSGSRNG